MTSMLNERMMLMLVVEPAFVVVVIGQGTARTGGNEDKNQDGSDEVSGEGFHILQLNLKMGPVLWGVHPM
jgi:hypothetical protein